MMKGMLCETLQRWQMSLTGRDINRMGLVFHTSCVNYGVDDLKALRSLFPRSLWILPDNVYLELRMLSRSPQFHEAAEFLTGQAGREKNPARRWDLEQLYRDCACPACPLDFYNRKLLFLFSDLLKQDEFLRMAIPQPGYEILLCEEWSPKQCMERHLTEISPVGACRNHVSRWPKRLNPLKSAQALHTYPDIWPDSDTRFRIPGNRFQPVPEYTPGAYARIYRCPDFPALLVKGYKDSAVTEVRLEKLRLLQGLSQNTLVGSLPLAMPVNLLFSRAEHCAGYTMKICPGKSLYAMLAANDPRLRDCAGALDHIISSLFLLILELHANHILVNDLSLRNVVVSDGNQAGLVDCDSFQILWYPGGSMKDDFKHKDIRMADADSSLREPMYEYFALAVLLFKCFFGDPSPLVRVSSDHIEWSWETHTFPLDVHGYPTDKSGVPLKDENGVPFKVNAHRYKQWMEVPEAFRNAFADEFHFRRVVSVGAWIRTLELTV